MLRTMSSFMMVYASNAFIPDEVAVRYALHPPAMLSFLLLRPFPPSDAALSAFVNASLAPLSEADLHEKLLLQEFGLLQETGRQQQISKRRLRLLNTV